VFTIIGFAAIALAIVAVLAACGKVDIDKEVSILGYSFEFQFNEKVPLGIMVSKES
jgi:hypothetical protein